MKVLASDYDRTFYLNDEDVEINKHMVEIFCEKGNLFIFNTGRSYLDFKKKEEAYELRYDYVILNHGATILDKNDQVLFNVFMNDKVIPRLKEMLELEKAADVFCCSALDSRVDFDHLSLTKIHVRYQEEIAPMIKDRLLEILKIEKKNVFTIGDGDSDIEMVKEYNGYCMENSVDELKKVAINEVSSVSQLVEKLLMNE